MVSLKWHIRIISKGRGSGENVSWTKGWRAVEHCLLGVTWPIVPAATLVERGPAQDGAHQFAITRGRGGLMRLFQPKIYRQLTAVGKGGVSIFFCGGTVCKLPRTLYRSLTKLIAS